MASFLLDKNLREERYEIAQNAEKGELVICPSCGDNFKKTKKSKNFCSTRCRINYHNKKK